MFFGLFDDVNIFNEEDDDDKGEDGSDCDDWGNVNFFGEEGLLLFDFWDLIFGSELDLVFWFKDIVIVFWREYFVLWYNCCLVFLSIRGDISEFVVFFLKGDFFGDDKILMILLILLLIVFCIFFFSSVFFFFLRIGSFFFGDIYVFFNVEYVNLVYLGLIIFFFGLKFLYLFFILMML